jgi:hypothetical protein
LTSTASSGPKLSLRAWLHQRMTSALPRKRDRKGWRSEWPAKKQVGIRYPRHPKTFVFWCWLVSNVNPSGGEDFYHPDETTDIHHQAARKALANRCD